MLTADGTWIVDQRIKSGEQSRSPGADRLANRQWVGTRTLVRSKQKRQPVRVAVFAWNALVANRGIEPRTRGFSIQATGSIWRGYLEEM